MHHGLLTNTVCRYLPVEPSARGQPCTANQAEPHPASFRCMPHPSHIFAFHIVSLAGPCHYRHPDLYPLHSPGRKYIRFRGHQPRSLRNCIREHRRAHDYDRLTRSERLRHRTVRSRYYRQTKGDAKDRWKEKHQGSTRARHTTATTLCFPAATVAPRCQSE